MTYSEYRRDLFARFLRYRRDKFGDADYFDRPLSAAQTRPPVFKPPHIDKNILLRPGGSDAEHAAVLQSLAHRKRHRHFASMRSSQALAQSVFGNLKVNKQLDCLLDLRDRDGQHLFFTADSDACSLEHELDYLGEAEGARTSVDVMFIKGYRVAVECKLTEDNVGCCSRPDLKIVDPQYLTDFCSGSYTFQMNRTERCSLTSKGIRYWEFLSEFTSWPAYRDQIPCPLHRTYQILRNLLAACVSPTPEIKLDSTNGHVVLVFDERNPAFQASGKGYAALMAAKRGLKDPTRLRECSWQQIMAAMRTNSRLNWLTKSLHLKYGL